jgi:hypothetical protein
MSEISSLVAAQWPLAPSSSTDWLLELGGDGLTGFMPPALPEAVWMLNTMYEHERGPADLSYDEYRQARLADGSSEPHVVGAWISTPWWSPPGAAWAAPSTRAVAGDACAGRSSRSGPGILSYPRGSRLRERLSAYT